MPGEQISVPKWTTRVVPVVALIVAGTVGFLAWGDARYVTRTEWVHAEGAESKEANETKLALDRHIDQTRLDATRLSVIETQLRAIEQQLNVIASKLDKAAARREAIR